MSTVKVGGPVPAFKAVTHTGAAVSSESLAGTSYCLWFYPRADTGGWTAEGLAFTELSDAYAAKGVAIYGVSCDTVDANAAFHEKFAFSFPLLCDLDKSVTRAFDTCKPSKDGADPCASSARSAVVVDAAGTVVRRESPFDAREGPAALLAAL